MEQCNGRRGRVWQCGPVRLVLVTGFIQLRWRRAFCLSWFTMAGDSEVWLGVPGWTRRLWPPAAIGDRRSTFGEREHENDGEGA